MLTMMGGVYRFTGHQRSVFTVMEVSIGHQGSMLTVMGGVYGATRHQNSMLTTMRGVYRSTRLHVHYKEIS